MLQSRALLNHEHDVCKLRIAVHLLKATRPDLGFEPLVNLVADCKAPVLQKAHGKTRSTRQRMMYHCVIREVRSTGLIETPDVDTDS